MTQYSDWKTLLPKICLSMLQKYPYPSMEKTLNHSKETSKILILKMGPYSECPWCSITMTLRSILDPTRWRTTSVAGSKTRRRKLLKDLSIREQITIGFTVSTELKKLQGSSPLLIPNPWFMQMSLTIVQMGGEDSDSTLVLVKRSLQTATKIGQEVSSRNSCQWL